MMVRARNASQPPCDQADGADAPSLGEGGTARLPDSDAGPPPLSTGNARGCQSKLSALERVNLLECPQVAYSRGDLPLVGVLPNRLVTPSPPFRSSHSTRHKRMPSRSVTVVLTIWSDGSIVLMTVGRTPGRR
jgi:hypothetical protein